MYLFFDTESIAVAKNYKALTNSIETLTIFLILVFLMINNNRNKRHRGFLLSSQMRLYSLNDKNIKNEKNRF